MPWLDPEEHHTQPETQLVSLVMDARADLRWGRPLDDYAPSYDLAAARERATATLEMEEEAQVVKIRICGEALSIRGHASDPENLLELRDVDLLMLEAILKLTLSPRHFDFFADPMFIGGCIRLLTRAKPEPFSYEFGYLCFKIIAIGIGAWILKVTNNLDMAIQNMETDHGVEPLLMFSGHLFRVIINNISAGDRASDWLMGWEKFEQRPDPQPFLSPSDLLNMLKTLWEDRKLYFQAISRTYFPALSGLVFVLWRYTCSSSSILASSRNKLMTVPFCELLWRSMLVATEDQFTTLHCINNLVHYSEIPSSWHESPKVVDLEDSCTLLNALSVRLAPVNSRLFQHLPLLPLVTLLYFIVGTVQPGSEGCYPTLFGNIVGRIWGALEEGEILEDIIDTAGTILRRLGEMIERLNRTSHASREAQQGIVAALEQQGFLELIGRFLFLLKPGDAPAIGDPQSNVPRNMWFLSNILYFVGTLAKGWHGPTLGHHFNERMDGWYKVEHALLVSQYIESSFPDPHKLLRRRCLEFWRKFGILFGLESQMLKLAGGECSYSRCPQLENVLPVEFICSGCARRGRRYCSAVCQSRDWTLGHGGWSHRQLCRSRVKPTI